MIVFAVPVHERHRLATVCLRQLRKVCDEIGDASAVLAGQDPRFQKLAGELGFDWVTSPNDPLGRKWNDAYYHAAVRMDADHVVPLGSDDVVHPSLFENLPDGDVIVCTRYSAIVSPDGQRLVSLFINTYQGGDGIRIWPRSLLERLMFRPCQDDRRRAIDGSTAEHLARLGIVEPYLYRNTDPLAIIDFKTDTPDQRNSFLSCLTFAAGERTDVVDAVASWHGSEFADEIAYVYGLKRSVAA